MLAAHRCEESFLQQDYELAVEFRDMDTVTIDGVTHKSRCALQPSESP